MWLFLEFRFHQSQRGWNNEVLNCATDAKNCFRWKRTSKHLQIFCNTSFNSPNKAWVLPEEGEICCRLEEKWDNWKNYTIGKVRKLEKWHNSKSNTIGKVTQLEKWHKWHNCKCFWLYHFVESSCPVLVVSVVGLETNTWWRHNWKFAIAELQWIDWDDE